MVREILKKIGLSDTEINIYLLLLKNGYSKATILSKELKLARTTAYRFLSSLHDKGLVSESIQNNVKYFYPVEPERLSELLYEKIEEIQKVIPELKAIIGKRDEETKGIYLDL